MSRLKWTSFALSLLALSACSTRPGEVTNYCPKMDEGLLKRPDPLPLIPLDTTTLEGDPAASLKIILEADAELAGQCRITNRRLNALIDAVLKAQEKANAREDRHEQ